MPDRNTGGFGLKDYLSILRVHIIGIAVFGTIVLGWLITGRYLVWIALIGGFDWLLINLANRVSDTVEDIANDIPGTRKVADSRTAFLLAFIVLLAGSFIVSILLYPQITAWRILIQITGLLYNFKLIPGKSGRTRLKDRYFLKNFLSAFGFFITCFGYPLAMCGYSPAIGWAAVVVLVLYFVPYELTFEIFYDLRDVDGDRVANVRTYPVVHGEKTSVKIIDALLAGSFTIILAAFLLGIVGVREGLLAAGPLLQFFILHPRIKRGVTTGDCIRITNIGTAMLAFYWVATSVWLWLGLPENVFL